MSWNNGSPCENTATLCLDCNHDTLFTHTHTHNHVEKGTEHCVSGVALGCSYLHRDCIRDCTILFLSARDILRGRLRDIPLANRAYGANSMLQKSQCSE
jgi:hypothetical protein